MRWPTRFVFVCVAACSPFAATRGDTPPDADARADAKADASLAERPDASTGFCRGLTPGPYFCDDFDNEPLATKWPFVDVPNGSIVQDGLTFTSSPRSLLAEIHA